MTDTYNQSGLTYDSAAVTYNGEDALTSVFPLVGVFVAFTDGPYVASPGWTEITEYVRGITTSRGRADDLQDFDAGTAQLVLDNRERRFDPFNTAGPYYLNLTPRRQIKIVAQAGGVNYDVFRGYIAGWPVTWSEAGYDSTVTIQAFDALGLMVNEIVPTDWPGYITNGLSPTRYFRCNDAVSSQVAVDQITNGAVRLTNFNPSTNPYQFEANALGEAFLSNSLFFPRYKLDDTTVAQSFDFTWSWGAWVRGYGESGTNFNRILFGFGNVSWAIRITTGGLDVSVVTGNATFSSDVYTISVTAAYIPSFGQPFHLVIVNNPTTRQAPTIYINGVSVPYTSAFFGLATYPNYLNVEIQNLNVQDLVFFRRLLTSSEVNAIYGAGRARLTETTSARMERLRATTDYPAALTSFTTSPVASVSEIGSGSGVIPEMQLTTDSEGGEFYATKSGVLTMTSRFDAFNATRSATSQATFTDSGTGVRYGPEVTIEYDADALKNDITVNFTGDGEIGVYSDAVIEAYGGAALTIETYLDSPAAATALGNAKLGVYGALVPRVSPIEVSVNTAATDWQTILGLELLDRVTFKRTPATGPQFNREALVNGIEHQIEPGVWRTQLAFSMRYTSPLICDDDVLGTVDFNYCG